MQEIKSVEELKRILKDKEFVLYGAGFGGWLFVEYFCKKYQVFPRLIIDKKLKYGKTFLKIPGKSIEEILNNKDLKKILWIITVGNKKYFTEICNNLKLLGIKKLITLSQDLWNNLKLQEEIDSYQVKITEIFTNYVPKITNTCILHIGMHKTGSTSIQISLNNFQNENFYYSKTSYNGCHNLPICILFGKEVFKHFYFNIVPKEIFKNKNELKNFLKLELILAKPKNFILSAEHILLFNKTELHTLKNFLISYYPNLLILGYIREPFGYISSIFQQNLKYFNLKFNDINSFYPKYKNLFNKIFLIFGKENVILKRFALQKFPEKCVVLDFCKTLGIPIKKIYRANIGFPSEIVKLLYIFRKFYCDLEIPHWYIFPFLTNFLKNLLSNYPLTPFKISKEVIKPIVEANIEDVRWMEKVLGEPLIDEEALKEPEPDWVIKKEEDLLTLPDEVIEALRDYTNYKLSNTKPIPQQVAEMLYQILKENFPDVE